MFSASFYNEVLATQSAHTLYQLNDPYRSPLSHRRSEVMERTPWAIFRR